MEQSRTDVAVVGGGPAGLTAALALASAGVPTVLIGNEPAADNRTTALLASSVNALKALGVWPECAAKAAPLKVLRIVDDTRRLWRAPEARFEADEIGLDAFAWNIENRHLMRALGDRAREFASLEQRNDQARAIEFGDGEVEITLASGSRIVARLLVAADGRQSLCRTAAGIETDSRRYRQTALTFTLRHARPHGDISTEFHTEQGPFTLVPLNGLRSSLVWVVEPTEARRLAALDDATLGDAIERRSHSILGKIAVEPGRAAFPLAVETACAFAGHRIALVGEAAHVIPPIGAQGLNLGMRDAATIGEIVAHAHRAGRDVGAAAVTAEYDRRRRADATGRAVAVDLLNRSLLSDFLPTQGARGLGLYALNQIGPLRRAVMREGVAPAGSLPELMRGEAHRVPLT